MPRGAPKRGFALSSLRALGSVKGSRKMRPSPGAPPASSSATYTSPGAACADAAHRSASTAISEAAANLIPLFPSIERPMLLGPLNRPGDVHPGTHVELAEDVPQVALDSLLAEEEPLGDLGVGQALDHETCDLAFPAAERLDPVRAAAARGRPARWPLSQTTELELDPVAVVGRPTLLEFVRRELELSRRGLGIPTGEQGAARELPGPRSVEAST